MRLFSKVSMDFGLAEAINLEIMVRISLSVKGFSFDEYARAVSPFHDDIASMVQGLSDEQCNHMRLHDVFAEYLTSGRVPLNSSGLELACIVLDTIVVLLHELRSKLGEEQFCLKLLARSTHIGSVKHLTSPKGFMVDLLDSLSNQGIFDAVMVFLAFDAGLGLHNAGRILFLSGRYDEGHVLARFFRAIEENAHHNTLVAECISQFDAILQAVLESETVTPVEGERLSAFFKSITAHLRSSVVPAPVSPAGLSSCSDGGGRTCFSVSESGEAKVVEADSPGIVTDGSSSDHRALLKASSTAKPRLPVAETEAKAKTRKPVRKDAAWDDYVFGKRNRVSALIGRESKSNTLAAVFRW